MKKVDYKDLTDLIIVPGHAVYTGEGSALDEKNWELESYQAGNVGVFVSHIHKGIEILQEHEKALLIFSGGITHPAPNIISEAFGYMAVAKKMGWILPEIIGRIFMEEFASDSYENLLFSICRFHEVTGNYPLRITVVGFDFKKDRFNDFHLKAIGYPSIRFTYIGINMSGDIQKELQGEKKNGYDQFKKDLYGCDTFLKTKKVKRNPYRRFKRIEKINISVGKRIQRDFSIPEENSSFFGETLAKYVESNLTKEFAIFYKSVAGYGQTLPQIVFHKEEIISLMVETIQNDNQLALEPLFELTKSLAKDLSSDFNPYFIRFFSAITNHAKSGYIEIIEHAYDTLAFLLKFCQKFLSSDLRPTFDVLSPLLGAEKQKSHIRRFAAESLSFMIRKLKHENLKLFIEHVFSYPESFPNLNLESYTVGISILFFQSIKGVEKQLYSSSDEIFKQILNHLDHNLNNNVYLKTLTNVFKMTLHQSGNPSVSAPIWKVLLNYLASKAEDLQSEFKSNKINSLTVHSNLNYKTIITLLNLISEGSTLRKGTRVGDYKDLLNSVELVISALKQIFSNPNDHQIYEKNNSDMFSATSKCFSSILAYCPPNFLVTTGRIVSLSFFNLLCASKQFSHGFQLVLVLGKMKWSHFYSMCLPLLVDLSNSCWEADNHPSSSKVSKNQLDVLLVWSHLIRFGVLKDTQNKAVSQISNGKIVLYSKSSKSDTFLKGLVKLVEGSIGEMDTISSKNSSNQIYNLVDVISISLAILQVSSVNLESMSQKILNLIYSVVGAIEKNKTDNSDRLSSKPTTFYSDDCESLYTECSLLGQAVCMYSELISQSLQSDSEKVVKDFANKGLDLFSEIASNVLRLDLLSAEGESILSAKKIAICRKNPCLLNSLALLTRSLNELSSSANQNNSKFEKPLSSFNSKLNKQFLNYSYVINLVIPSLLGNLSSFNKELRRSTLKFIESLIMNLQTPSAAESVNIELINELVAAENCGIGLNEYRDKMNHVRKIVSVILNNESINTNLSRMSANLIVSFLGLNFSLIWKELNTLFAQMDSDNRSSNKAKLFAWDSLFKIINRIYAVKHEKINWLDYIEPKLTQSATNLFNEEFKLLSNLEQTSKLPLVEGIQTECPFNNKFNSIYNYYSNFLPIETEEHDDSPFDSQSKSFSLLFSMHGIAICEFSDENSVISEGNSPNDLVKPKIDYNVIITNTFNAMASFSSVSGQHTDILVQVFNKIMSVDWNKNKQTLKTGNKEYDILFNFDLGSDLEKTRRVRLDRLYSSLTLLSKVGKLKKHAELNDVCLKLLNSGDLRTQKAALEVILSYNSQIKNSDFVSFSDDLKNLLHKDTIKDTILNFSLDSRYTPQVQPSKEQSDSMDIDQPIPLEFIPETKSKDIVSSSSANVDSVIPVLLRILFGRLVSKGGNKSNKTSMKTRRTIILKVLASLKPEEISFFGSLILDHFADALKPISDIDPSIVTENATKENIFPDYTEYLEAFRNIRTKTKVGFLKLVTEMVKQLGVKITPIFHKIMTTNLFILGSCQNSIDLHQSKFEIQGESFLSDDDSDQGADDEEEKVVDEDEEDDDNEDMVDEHVDSDGEDEIDLPNPKRNISKLKTTPKELEMENDFDEDDEIDAESDAYDEESEGNETEHNSSKSSSQKSKSVDNDQSDISDGSDTEASFKTKISNKRNRKQKKTSSLFEENIDNIEIDSLDNEADDDDYDITGELKSADKSPVYIHKIALKIRQMAVNLLSLLISVHPEHQRFPIKPYFFLINEFAISPRVEKLSIENTQSESSLLDMINKCCKSPDTLTLLFTTNKSVFPNLISLFSAKKLSDSVTHRVLDILSGLIGLEEYYNTSTVNDPRIIQHRDAAISCIKSVLEENSSHIISQIQLYLQSNYSVIRTKNRILVKLVFALSNIAEYVSSKSPKDLSLLLELLLPFVYSEKPKNAVRLTEKTKSEILKLLNRFIPMLFCENSDVEYNARRQFDSLFIFVSKLFLIHFQDIVNRKLIVSIFENLTKHYDFIDKNNDLTFVTQVIKDLNSYSLKRMDEPDFDKRLHCFNELNEKWFNDTSLIGSRAWLPLLTNLLYFSKDEVETSIRSNSTYGITRFIEAVSFRLSEGPAPEYVNLIEHTLYPDITKSLSTGSTMIKQENVKILGVLASNLGSKIEILNDLVIFTTDDEESSFFFNILHLQAHRRKRALTRFCTKLNSGYDFRQKTLTNLFIPFFESILFSLELQSSHELVSELINTLSEIATKLTFNNYFAMIRRYMNKKNVTIERVLTRLIISVLQSFKFDLRSTPSEGEEAHVNKMISQVEKVLLPQLKKYISLTGMIFESQQEREDKLLQRVPVGISYVKILKSCPDTIMNAHLPYLLMILCGLLKVRRQETRDTTRLTLSKILELLGPNYFGFVLDSLVTTLQKGFMKHVLCYSLNYLLTNIKYEPGSLDYTIEKITNVFIKSMFENIKDESKSMNNTYKETRTGINKAPLSLELLSQIVGINKISVLLLPLIDILNLTNSVSTIKLVKRCLQNISSGLIKNKGLFSKQKKIYSSSAETLEAEKSENNDEDSNVNLIGGVNEIEEGDLMEIDRESESMQSAIGKKEISNLLTMLKFVFALIFNHHHYEATKAVYVKNIVVKKAVSETSNLKSNSNIIVEFGLQLLLSIFKSGNLQFSSKKIPEEIMEELKKFIDLIGNCLFSNHDGVVLLSLRISGILIKFKSGSMLTLNELKIIVKRCLQLLKSSSSAKSPVTISCLQLISSILKSQSTNDGNSLASNAHRSMLMTKTQLDFMVSLIKPDLEVEEFQSVSFSLLTGIINNKLISNDLYDLIDTSVQTLMVKSYSKFVRTQCRACLLRFYINYPITLKRLQNLINFVMSNIEGFEVLSGRESGLDFLYSAVESFPTEIICEMYEEMFVKLVMALVNENEQNLVEMISLVLKKLFVKMNESQLATSFELVMHLINPPTISSLIETDSPDLEKKLILWKASLQIFGISIECITDATVDDTKFLKNAVIKLMPDILTVIVFALAKSTAVWKTCELEGVDIDVDEYSDSKAILLWQQGKTAVNSDKVLKVQFPKSSSRIELRADKKPKIDCKEEDGVPVHSCGSERDVKGGTGEVFEVGDITGIQNIDSDSQVDDVGQGGEDGEPDDERFEHGDERAEVCAQGAIFTDEGRGSREVRRDQDSEELGQEAVEECEEQGEFVEASQVFGGSQGC
ncbi:U3 small nucleolar RNA-associated protein 20 [Smittium culicis]|uniref:U3 small nucleolar RNA-associated protein 20 n=1 Tax=Smittium culicis TaxID=133412 RepID=A0A1R1YRB4_9FUNG|nr:U3 small nucleolar RNA-associated protein 20 [Smittium culicis]